jgi:hypothetical protein
MKEQNNITPITGLKDTASNIARSYGDKGAMIITTKHKGEVRIGTDGLTPEELRYALCTAIHYSFVFEDNSIK